MHLLRYSMATTTVIVSMRLIPPFTCLLLLFTSRLSSSTPLNINTLLNIKLINATKNLLLAWLQYHSLKVNLQIKIVIPLLISQNQSTVHKFYEFFYYYILIYIRTIKYKKNLLVIYANTTDIIKQLLLLIR